MLIACYLGCMHHLPDMIDLAGTAYKMLKGEPGLGQADRGLMPVTVDMPFTGEEYFGTDAAADQQVVIEVDEVLA